MECFQTPSGKANVFLLRHWHSHPEVSLIVLICQKRKLKYRDGKRQLPLKPGLPVPEPAAHRAL